MKVIGLQETNLDTCIDDAQHERIVITRDGKPVALVVGVEGLDAEQLELGSNAKFWELVTQRRQQNTMSRGQLEQELRDTKRQPRTTERAADGAAARKKRSPRSGG